MTGIRTSILSILAGLITAALAATAVADPLLPRTSQLGPRPFYLVDKLNDGDLKQDLERCANRKRNYRASDFSIGHRGAPLQFPEHTRESYIAAAQMGAGILECDVTFTSDLELVCRHAQCDLHTTTNILTTPLASQCSEGFAPAVLDSQGNVVTPASARCCTSDITLAEFKTLEGKMDAANRAALTPEEYVNTRGTADFRTDLYTTGGTLLTHAESIELFKQLDRKFTPELKSPAVTMPFNGFSQQDYAAKMIEEYIAAGVRPRDVWPQSFNYDDVLYWIDEYPAYGRQAVFLDGRYDQGIPLSDFEQRVDDGLNIIAPPMQILLTTDGDEIVPSGYAENAVEAGLDIISWTTERSGRINEDVVAAGGAFYYDTTVGVLQNDGDILRTIDVLVQEVGIFGLFSDWPATTTFYANCEDIPALKAMKKGRKKGKRYDDDGDKDDDDDDDDDD